MKLGLLIALFTNISTTVAADRGFMTFSSQATPIKRIEIQGAKNLGAAVAAEKGNLKLQPLFVLKEVDASSRILSELAEKQTDLGQVTVLLPNLGKEKNVEFTFSGVRVARIAPVVTRSSKLQHEEVAFTYQNVKSPKSIRIEQDAYLSREIVYRHWASNLDSRLSAAIFVDYEEFKVCSHSNQPNFYSGTPTIDLPG